MPKPVIPHDAFVFVGDGRKALFLRNAGDEKFANKDFTKHPAWEIERHIVASLAD